MMPERSSVPSPVDDEEILDLAILADLEAFGSDFVADLVDAFADQSVGMRAEIDAGLVAGDAQTVQGVAHMMKGSAGSLGLPSLANRAAELEDVAKTGSLAGAADPVVRMDVALGAGMEALRHHIRGLLR
jgi:HPt (histidine-containing phosphotransfer) domain-containing protein